MSFILCLLLFAELLTAATAEAASELESADEPPPGTAIPAEWGLAMRIVVSDEWRMNSEKFVPNVTKKTSSQVYNSVMHTLSIYTENTGNHCILTPFSFLRGAAFAGGSLIISQVKNPFSQTPFCQCENHGSGLSDRHNCMVKYLTVALCWDPALISLKR